MSALGDYFKERGAKPVNPEIVAGYDRQMRDETIPAIERDLRNQRIMSHYFLLGIPVPEGVLE